MSTTQFLSSLFNISGGVLPRKVVPHKGLNKALDHAYRSNVPRKSVVHRNRLHKKHVVHREPDLSDELMTAFSSLGISGRKIHRKKRSDSHDVAMSEPPRRSGRTRMQTQRWSPTAAAKKDKDAAKKSRKSKKSSPKRSRSASPMAFDFMKLRL